MKPQGACFGVAGSWNLVSDVTASLQSATVEFPTSVPGDTTGRHLDVKREDPSLSGRNGKRSYKVEKKAPKFIRSLSDQLASNKQCEGSDKLAFYDVSL